MTRVRVEGFTISLIRSGAGPNQDIRNPVNPIAGESLLLWLRERARPRFDVSEPDAEDWGWYASVICEGRHYMLGASASDDEGGEKEWVLQIVKQRLLGERLLGREKMAENDECASFFQRLLESEAGFKGVTIDEAR